MRPKKEAFVILRKSSTLIQLNKNLIVFVVSIVTRDEAPYNNAKPLHHMNLVY